MLGRRKFLTLGAGCAAALMAPRALAQQGESNLAEVPSLPPGDMALLAAPRLEIGALAAQVWRHTSWLLLDGGTPFPSNGLIIIGDRETLIIDTAWAEVDTPVLLERAAALAPGLPIRLAVTHAHGDRMSGVAIARERGVRSLAYELTQEAAPLRNLAPADETWRGRTHRIELGGPSVELFYPGPAHTRDNVVAFAAQSGVLFGGCMLRAANMGIGNTADADLGAYAQSVRAVMARYGARTRIVVPGHGDPGGPGLLRHTLRLAEAAAAGRAG